METGLLSFDTVINNSSYMFIQSWQSCPNELVKHCHIRIAVNVLVLLNKFVCFLFYCCL